LKRFLGHLLKLLLLVLQIFLLREDKETKAAIESMEADVIQLLAQKGFI
jgi:hypothetical protein